MITARLGRTSTLLKQSARAVLAVIIKTKTVSPFAGHVRMVGMETKLV